MSGYPFYDPITNLSICKCSFITAEEENKLSSYCKYCWNIIKKFNKCIKCNINVRNERLFVSVLLAIPLCKKCSCN